MGYNPPLIFGPIAPENNPPINPQYYQPSVFDITAIALGVNTTVTTSVAHNYVIGQNVRLLIPAAYGSIQLNEQQGLVIAIPATNQVVLNINSAQNVDPFIAMPAYGPTPPQIAAIGDQNSGTINTTGRSNTGTFIPGSFIDISPL
jgi:hypothetical protein